MIRYFKFVLLVTTAICTHPYSVKSQSLWPDTLRVGISGNEPFVVDTILHRGVSIEIWDALAAELNITYKPVYYNSVSDALVALDQGKINVVAGPVSITSERAEKALFTQPYFQSSLSIMSLAGQPTLWSRIKPFFSKRFFIALCVFLMILTIVGTVLWLAERKKNPSQFPKKPSKGIANGVWCAIVTMTTVGFGDIAPKTFWGRFAAGIWMIISIVFATSMVAGIASVLTISVINTSSITSTAQLSGKVIAVESLSPSEDFVQGYGGRIRGIKNLDEGYQLLLSKKVNAVVFDRSQLQYYLKQHPDPDVTISTAEYQRQGYGFAFSLKEKHLHEVNLALLEMMELGGIDKILEEWLGQPLE